jgi:imidazolonepropionase-like amidohydrolase
MASFLLTDVRIFNGQTTIDSGSILVEDGKISQVSSSPISWTGKTISKPGHTVLPGLIDCHVHCDSANPTALPQSLRFGVTTVCDMHNEFPNIEKLRKQIKEEGDCADLKTTSFAATVEMGWPMPVIVAHSTDPNIHEEFELWPKLEKPEDAKGYIADRVKEGVDYIKLIHESGLLMGQKFNMPSIELQKALIEEAHKNNLITVAHCLARQDTIAILEAGVDGLAHQFLDQPINQQVIDAYKRNNAHLNPTLAALGSLTTEGKGTQERFAHDPRVQHLLPEDARHRVCACMSMAKHEGASVENAYESVRQLKAAGIDVLM